MSIFSEIMSAYDSVPVTDDSSVLGYMLSQLTPEQREVWEAQAELYYEYVKSPGADPDDLSAIEPQLMELERRVA